MNAEPCLLTGLGLRLAVRVVRLAATTCALARAIGGGPQLLLFDEPLGALPAMRCSGRSRDCGLKNDSPQ